MKTSKYIYVALLSLALGLVSCEDMLQEENFGKPTVDEMLQSESNIISLVGQAYADLKFVHDHWGYWGVNTLTADEALCPTRAGGDWNDGGYWTNLNTHNWNAYGDAFRCIWNVTNEGAVLCNSLLATLSDAKENIDPKIYAQYVGELEVLRSYYYYMLFDCFGRIPYMEDYSDRVQAQMQPYEVWAHLVACLEKNAPNMAVVNDANRSMQLGRATQGVAYTLLARLYLNAESFGCTPENIATVKRQIEPFDMVMETAYTADETMIKIQSKEDFYTNAVRCCDKVINSGSYRIENNFFNNFLIENDESAENILVIPEDGTKNNEVNYDKVKNKLQITFLTLHYAHQKTWPALQDKPWNGFCARPDFIAIYNDDDARGPGAEGLGTNNTKRWGWFIGPVCKEGDDKPVVDDSYTCHEDSLVIITKEVVNVTDPTRPLAAAIRTSGARMYKYEVDKKGEYRYCQNNFVLLRYADVILMKTEAILRGGAGDMGNVSSAIQSLKKRAFAYSANAEAAFDAAYPDAFTSIDGGLTGGILAERGRELAWECARRRDLIRFGQFENVQYVTNKAKTRQWFPIPYKVLETSSLDEHGEKVWTQNEGY